MWTAEPYLLSFPFVCGVNLKLLAPRRVVEEAYRAGHAPLAAVERFTRQVTWLARVRARDRLDANADLRRGNALSADTPLPEFYWTGETLARCLRETITLTLEGGYAHHIQRLMVTGLYALLLGVQTDETLGSRERLRKQAPAFCLPLRGLVTHRSRQGTFRSQPG